MALDVNTLSKKLQEAAKAGMPSCASTLSTAIKSYCESAGTSVKGIKVTLLPMSGAGWSTLAAQATGSGVGDTLISTAITAEMSSSLTTIITPDGPQQIPSVFNSGAKVGDLSKCESFEEVWNKIAKGIISYLSTELK